MGICGKRSESIAHRLCPRLFRRFFLSYLAVITIFPLIPLFQRDNRLSVVCQWSSPPACTPVPGLSVPAGRPAICGSGCDRQIHCSVRWCFGGRFQEWRAPAWQGRPLLRCRRYRGPSPWRIARRPARNEGAAGRWRGESPNSPFTRRRSDPIFLKRFSARLCWDGAGKNSGHPRKASPGTTLVPLPCGEWCGEAERGYDLFSRNPLIYMVGSTRLELVAPAV